MTHFHLGDWEEINGFSQSVRVGNRILVSGSVGDRAEKELSAQMAGAYGVLTQTLAHDGATLQHVIKEVIYTTDIEALKTAQELRKTFYQGHLPAATWVQVERLYFPELLIEIEVEAVLS